MEFIPTRIWSVTSAADGNKKVESSGPVYLELMLNFSCQSGENSLQSQNPTLAELESTVFQMEAQIADLKKLVLSMREKVNSLPVHGEKAFLFRRR